MSDQAIQLISKEIKKASRHPIIKLFSQQRIYIFMDPSEWKINTYQTLTLYIIFSDFHFTDLIFFTEKSFKPNWVIKKIKFTKLILIDEFYINNLTNLIIF